MWRDYKIPFYKIISQKNYQIVDINNTKNKITTMPQCFEIKISTKIKKSDRFQKHDNTNYVIKFADSMTKLYIKKRLYDMQNINLQFKTRLRSRFSR